MIVRFIYLSFIDNNDNSNGYGCGELLSISR